MSCSERSAIASIIAIRSGSLLTNLNPETNASKYLRKFNREVLVGV